MKPSEWTEHCAAELQAAGLIRLSPNRFGRIKCGMLQIVNFQGRKNDIYIWRNTVPLSLPDLQLGFGCPPASKRLPSSPGSLTASSEADTRGVKAELSKLLVQSILPALNEIENLSALERLLSGSSMPHFAFFFRGFCLLQAGEFKRGRRMLLRKHDKPHPLGWSKHINRFTSVVGDTALEAAVQESVNDNIKKQKLGRLRGAT